MRETIVRTLALLGLASAVAAEDLPAIRQRGTLRVLAHYDTLRPEFFAMNPDAPGFDYELLQGFARAQKVELQVVEVAGGSDTRVNALLAGKGDLVAGRLAAVPQRLTQISHTIEVFPTRFVIVTRRPTPAITNVDELRRYKVGSVKTSRAQVELLNAAGVPAAQIDDGFAEPSEFLRGLQSGRVQAVIWGIESALPARKQDPAVQIGAYVGAPLSLVYGVRKEDVELRRALDEYLTGVKRSENWSRLVVKYFGESALEVLRPAREPSN
jgi:ABC-type amino acid transport substrate-binding protein